MTIHREAAMPTGGRKSIRTLTAGISVITSINLHYIQEMQEEVACITGKRPAETVPLEFLKRANDIEIIDAPAEEQQEVKAEGNGTIGGGGSRRV